MTTGGSFIFTCPGSTSDAPVDDFEVETIIKAYKVQVRVADGEQASVLFDATTRQWGQLAGQAILRGVLESVRPSFGLSLRLPASLVFIAFSGVSRIEIVDKCMSAVLVEEVPKPRAKGIKHKSLHNTDSGSNSTSDGEYEIDEYLEDEFQETQPY